MPTNDHSAKYFICIMRSGWCDTLIHTHTYIKFTQNFPTFTFGLIINSHTHMFRIHRYIKVMLQQQLI